jgi:signal transduction histidine kinase
VAIVRAHPDSHSVSVTVSYGDPAQTALVADGTQIERALCNLLLNACQAARPAGREYKVSVTLSVQESEMTVSIIDNGEGVPKGIRDSLFEPFVSEGKQKGTGLGLTLAHCIAVEHGGEVVLLRSEEGETVFQMNVLRGAQAPVPAVIAKTNFQDQVIEHENLRS